MSFIHGLCLCSSAVYTLAGHFLHLSPLDHHCFSQTVSFLQAHARLVQKWNCLSRCETRPVVEHCRTLDQWQYSASGHTLWWSLSEISSLQTKVGMWRTMTSNSLRLLCTVVCIKSAIWQIEVYLKNALKCMPVCVQHMSNCLRNVWMHLTKVHQSLWTCLMASKTVSVLLSSHID